MGGRHRRVRASDRARSRQVLRRPAERRHRRRCPTRPPGGLRGRRASQALHHAGHGNRPGQDQQRRRPLDDGGARGAFPSPRSAPPPSGRPTRPVAIGALAGRSVGRHFRPVRRTPLHDWHVANGASMTETGLWLRPWYYSWAGTTVEEAYVREMRQRARGRRYRRHLDARQNRRAGAGRAGAPGADLRQPSRRTRRSAARATGSCCATTG